MIAITDKTTKNPTALLRSGVQIVAAHAIAARARGSPDRSSHMVLCEQADEFVIEGAFKADRGG